MARLFHTTIPDALDDICAACARHPDAEVEIWTFDSPRARQSAERALTPQAARVRSAYKPLVFAFLEDIALDGVDTVTIAYPIVDGVPPERFRLECYPITDLIASTVAFVATPPQDPARLLTYTVTLAGAAGTTEVQIAAPNTFVTDHTGAMVLANTGWLRLTTQDGEIRDQPVVTGQQRAFRAAMAAIAAQDWRGRGPHFDRLTVQVAAPVYDHPLPVPGEHISTAEAMHEELYFGALELCHQAAKLPPGDRTLQPGQIVPRIVPRQGSAEVTITTGPAAPLADIPPAPTDWETTTAPPDPAAIKACLDALGGEPYAATSRHGRPVWGTFMDGEKPGLVISANQHGNETTGIVGALRAAQRLRDSGLAVAVSPSENPDGYALYRNLCQTHPHHMHHAARYTASGNDLEYAERGFENEVRHIAREKTAAHVHLNLHGYPAHEWVHPFTGYQPRGFEGWTIPKGFFLILRANPDRQAQADDLLAAVTAALNADETLVAFNTRQITRYRQYFPDAALTLHGAIPVFTGPAPDNALFPITLITEAPDEGATGADYALFHTAHMRAVLAAAALGATPA